MNYTGTEKVQLIDSKLTTLNTSLVLAMTVKSELNDKCKYTEYNTASNQVNKIKNQISKLSKYRYQLFLTGEVTIG